MGGRGQPAPFYGGNYADEEPAYVIRRYDGEESPVDGDRRPEGKAPAPSFLPHLGRVVAFERTPMEAWHEYLDERERVVNERHAVRIQAAARGMRDRYNAQRLKVEESAAVLIQKHARAKLARRRLEDMKRQFAVVTLFANAERKAVMKLELAYLKRLEKKRRAATTVLQAQYRGRKARLHAKEERTKRKVAYIMAKGQAKAALRIQYAWWAYRVKLLAQRREAEEAALRARVAEEEKARQEVARREAFIMAKPLFKKSRRLFRFQTKQMTIDTQLRKLNYWRYVPNAPGKQQVKEVPLEHVVTIELKDAPFHGIILGLKSAGATRNYVFKMEDKEAAEVWLQHIRAAAPSAAFIETRQRAT